jgi:3-hydroxyacyl-CoA dehydrogenase/enoyl-CoA hydratase/3-hydroxybutyryl-CoA epimerase
LVLLAILSSLACLIILTIIYLFFTHSVSFAKEVIDFTTLTYAAFEDTKIEYSFIDQLLNSNSSYGKFFHEILVKFYLYITSLIPSVTDNIYDIDTAMRLGYSWKIGSFELLINHIGGGFEWLKK